MRISTKISMFIMGAGLLTMLGVGYFGFILTQLLLERTISNSQVQLARQTLDQIDQYIYHRWYDIISLSQDTALKTFLSTRSASSPVIALELSELKNIIGPWEQLMVTDPAGNILVHMQEKTQNLPEDITQSPELLHALEEAKKNAHYYSDIQLSSRTQQYVLTFSAPVIGTADNKTIVGAVIGQIAWSAVLAPLETIPADIHIFNNRGELLGNNHQELPEYIFKKDPRVSSLFSMLKQKKELSTVSENTKDRTQILFSSVMEKGFLDYRGNGWTLTIETPTQVVFAPAVKNILTVLLIIIPIVILIGAFLFLILRMFVVAPIHRVQKGLDIIASGNLDYHIDASSNDELGKLARAFNNMAGQIKEIHGTLEQKINAQTENLNEKIILLQETERALINVMDDLEKEKASIARDRAEYKALIESIGDGVIALDDKGYITYINQNAANMLGWEREHIAHAHYTDVWTVQNESGKILSQEERPMFQALVSGKKTTTSLTPTYYYTRKNGTRFPVAISITPIIIDSVNKGVIDIFKDITHLKEIDKAKGEFVSLASHQLRTPTATINWYTELLLNGSAGAVTRKQKDFLEEIYTAAKRMVQLIDALLNVSRLELGTLPIKKIPTDIALLIDDIIHELSQDIKRKKISIKKDYQDRLLPLFTDPDLIRIIFENLISNAVDYNHENGSLILSIKKENSHLLISIADTGYGIPKHQQSQIFQKMFRADNIRIIDPNGNGLGLYMTKSILEKLGGAIWFKSEEDKGTTFFFTLPL